MKPVKVRELKEAIAKVQSEVLRSPDQNISILLDNMKSSSEAKKNLVISDSKGFTVVRVSDIIMCMADGFCTHLFLTGNRKITSSKILKYYEEILPKAQFMRVHHSYIINIEHVNSYNNQGLIYLSEDASCPLSTLHKSSFVNKLKHLM